MCWSLNTNADSRWGGDSLEGGGKIGGDCYVGAYY